MQQSPRSKQIALHHPFLGYMACAIPRSHASMDVTAQQSRPRCRFQKIKAVLAVMTATLAVFASNSDAAPSARVFVATNGFDSNNGSSNSPVRTIRRAQDLARSNRINNVANRAAGYVIEVAPGFHVLPESVVFTAEDSGTGTDPTILRGTHTNAPPVLSGALMSTPNTWTMVAGSPEWEITWWGPAAKPPRELYLGTNRLSRPRLPVGSGYFIAKDALPQQEWRSQGLIFDRTILTDTSVIIPDQTEVVLFHSWNANNLIVQSVNTQNDTLLFKTNARYPLTMSDPYKRFYFNNVNLPLLPGEWKLVPGPTPKVRYRPLSATDDPNLFVFHAPALRTLIHFNGNSAQNQWVTNITIDNLILRYSARESEVGAAQDGLSNTHSDFRAAIYGDAVERVTVKRCEIFGAGEHGIRFLGATRDVDIIQNHIHDIGSGGIYIGDTTPASDFRLFDPTTLGDKIARDVVISANIISDGSRTFPTGTGIVVGHAHDIRVSQNRIANFDYSGIAMGRVTSYQQPSVNSNNVIADNHISNIGNRVLSDGGGIYLLGRSPATFVNRNWITDCAAYRRTSKIAGIYLDEGSSGITVQQNLIRNMEQTGFTFHYGASNIVQHNVFLNPGWDPIQIVRMDDRTNNEFTDAVRFRNNVVILTAAGRQEVSDLVPVNSRDAFPRFLAITNSQTTTAFGASNNQYWSDRGLVTINGNDLNGFATGTNHGFGTTTPLPMLAPPRESGSKVADPGVSLAMNGWVASITNLQIPFAGLPTTTPGVPSGLWHSGRVALITPRPLGVRLATPLTPPARVFQENFNSNVNGGLPLGGTTYDNGPAGSPAIFATNIIGSNLAIRFTGNTNGAYTEYETNLGGETLVAFSIFIPSTSAGSIRVFGTSNIDDEHAQEGAVVNINSSGRILITGGILVGTMPTDEWVGIRLRTIPRPDGSHLIACSARTQDGTTYYADSLVHLDRYTNLNSVFFSPIGAVGSHVLIDSLYIGYP